MKHALALLALVLALSAAPADAACVAEYKAKRDNPLRLDYGLMVVPDNACTVSAAWGVVGARLAQQGWVLLNILSVKQN